MSSTLASINYYKKFRGQPKYEKAIAKESARYLKYKQKVLDVEQIKEVA